MPILKKGTSLEVKTSKGLSRVPAKGKDQGKGKGWAAKGKGKGPAMLHQEPSSSSTPDSSGLTAPRADQKLWLLNLMLRDLGSPYREPSSSSSTTDRHDLLRNFRHDLLRRFKDDPSTLTEGERNWISGVLMAEGGAVQDHATHGEEIDESDSSGFSSDEARARDEIVEELDADWECQTAPSWPFQKLAMSHNRPSEHVELRCLFCCCY